MHVWVVALYLLTLACWDMMSEVKARFGVLTGTACVHTMYHMTPHDADTPPLSCMCTHHMTPHDADPSLMHVYTPCNPPHDAVSCSE